MFTMGIDIGSTSSKAVILEDGVRVAARKVIEAGIGSEGPDRVFADALSEAGITREEITRVMATGYGRMTFPGADDQASELSCHGKGIHYLIPEARSRDRYWRPGCRSDADQGSWSTAELCNE